MTKPVPRLTSVTAHQGYSLTVLWTEGRQDRVDLSGWIATGGPYFGQLFDEDLFQTASLGEFGLSVQWADNEDLSIDSIHLLLIAEQQRPLDDQGLAAWQIWLNLSNQEAAEFHGVGLSTWHNWKSGTHPVPHSAQIICRAVERELVLFEAHFRPNNPGRPKRPAA